MSRLAVVDFKPQVTLKENVVIDGRRPVHSRPVRIEAFGQPGKETDLLGRGGVNITFFRRTMTVAEAVGRYGSSLREAVASIENRLAKNTPGTGF